MDLRNKGIYYLICLRFPPNSIPNSLGKFMKGDLIQPKQ